MTGSSRQHESRPWAFPGRTDARAAAGRALTAVLATSLLTLAGCSSNGAHRPINNIGATGSVRSRVVADTAPARSARALCMDAFAGRHLLGWHATTVADLRAYQYGGPLPHRPLAHAFGTTAGSTRAAWCVRRTGRETDAFYGVVSGSSPAHAISVTGPGEGEGEFIDDSAAALPRVP